jgi:hypothetical protein
MIGQAFKLDGSGMPWSDQRWPLVTVCPVSSTAAVPENAFGVPLWCDWLYVHCDPSSKSVVSFEAARYGSSYGSYFPQSTLPSAFGSLPNLQRIKLRGGHLNGTIPSVLGSLSQLTLLDLSYNQLTGTIPAMSMPFVPIRSRSSGSDSSQLVLSYNYLVGTVPSFVSNLQFTYLGSQRQQFLLYGNCDLQSTVPAVRNSLTSQGRCQPPANLTGTNERDWSVCSNPRGFDWLLVFIGLTPPHLLIALTLSPPQPPLPAKVSPCAKWPAPWSRRASLTPSVAPTPTALTTPRCRYISRTGAATGHHRSAIATTWSRP